MRLNASQREKRRLKKLRAKVRGLESTQIGPPNVDFPNDPNNFGKAVLMAIDAAKTLNPEFTNQQALGFVCKEWLVTRSLAKPKGYTAVVFPEQEKLAAEILGIEPPK